MSSQFLVLHVIWLIAGFPCWSPGKSRYIRKAFQTFHFCSWFPSIILFQYNEHEVTGPLLFKKASVCFSIHLIFCSHLSTWSSFLNYSHSFLVSILQSIPSPLYCPLGYKLLSSYSNFLPIYPTTPSGPFRATSVHLSLCAGLVFSGLAI